MQIEADILTASMVAAFFGSGHYEGASDADKSLCRNVVMGGYQDACERQAKKDEEDERAKACEALRIEIDYIKSILIAVQKNPINSSSINVMIASLPCERNLNRPCLRGMSYATNASHATDFVTRLLDDGDMGHLHNTFNSLKANPYISGPDAVLLLSVGLQMHAVKLTQRRQKLFVNVG